MTKQHGFTLIEVLIAVAVLAIALIAITRNTSLAASETSYLQQRTVAHWVAMDIMAQTRVGLISPPPTGSSRSGGENLLGQQWLWEIKIAPTGQERVVAAQVIVSDAIDHKQMDSINSYLLLPKIL